MGHSKGQYWEWQAKSKGRHAPQPSQRKRVGHGVSGLDLALHRRLRRFHHRVACRWSSPAQASAAVSASSGPRKCRRSSATALLVRCGSSPRIPRVKTLHARPSASRRRSRTARRGNGDTWIPATTRRSSSRRSRAPNARRTSCFKSSPVGRKEQPRRHRAGAACPPLAEDGPCQRSRLHD